MSDKKLVATSMPSNWPPASLSGSDVWNIRHLTESLEAAGSLDPLMLQIQMAALLFLGDMMAARHLWRRHEHNEALRVVLGPWWKVGAALYTNDGVWPALGSLPQSAAAASPDGTTTISVAQYAQDIAHAYRMRILHPFVTQQNVVPSMLVATLGFGSMPDLDAFCVQNFGTAYDNDNSASNIGNTKESSLSMNEQAALLAFLESQLAL